MDETKAVCEVCGRERLNRDGPWAEQCFRDARGYTDNDCYRLGYERLLKALAVEKAAREKAEAGNTRLHGEAAQATERHARELRHEQERWIRAKAERDDARNDVAILQLRLSGTNGTTPCTSAELAALKRIEALEGALAQIVNASVTEFRPLVEHYGPDPASKGTIYPGTGNVHRSFATEREWEVARAVSGYLQAIAERALASPSESAPQPFGGLLYDTLTLLDAEICRARTKFPGNRLLLAALTEEVGELARALLQRQGDASVQKEALQVACVALRIVEEGDATFTNVSDAEALP